MAGESQISAGTSSISSSAWALAANPGHLDKRLRRRNGLQLTTGFTFADCNDRVFVVHFIIARETLTIEKTEEAVLNDDVSSDACTRQNSRQKRTDGTKDPQVTFQSVNQASIYHSGHYDAAP